MVRDNNVQREVHIQSLTCHKQRKVFLDAVLGYDVEGTIAGCLGLAVGATEICMCSPSNFTRLIGVTTPWRRNFE